MHITSRADWQDAQRAGQYTHPSLTADGYIHCSLPTEEQLVAVANAHFAGKTDLVGLEEFGDSGLFFPHVYGPVHVGAVVQVLDFPPGADGSFSLPDSLLTPETARTE